MEKYLENYKEDYGALQMEERDIFLSPDVVIIRKMSLDEAIESMLARLEIFDYFTPENIVDFTKFPFQIGDDRFIRLTLISSFIIKNGLTAFREASEKMAEQMAQSFKNISEENGKVHNIYIYIYYVACNHNKFGMYELMLRRTTFLDSHHI